MEKQDDLILSIITINLNNINGLKRTIESVLMQSFKNFEWIVIDGNSTDGSKELLEQNKSNIDVFVCESDSGIYNAINKGIKLANGEFLEILNSGDCLHDTDTLERVFQQKLSGDINYGDIVRIFPDGHKDIQKYNKPISLHYFKAGGIINHQATFFRRKVFDNHLYDEKYSIASDWAYCIEAVCRGLTFNHIDQIIVDYDNSGISTQWSSKQLEEREDILNKYIPAHLKPDMDTIDQVRQFQFHKSTSFLYCFFVRVCMLWNRLLTFTERLSHR